MHLSQLNKMAGVGDQQESAAVIKLGWECIWGTKPHTRVALYKWTHKSEPALAAPDPCVGGPLCLTFHQDSKNSGNLVATQETAASDHPENETCFHNHPFRTARGAEARVLGATQTVRRAMTTDGLPTRCRKKICNAFGTQVVSASGAWEG